MNKNNFNQLEDKFLYSFKNKSLLTEALTHRSYANEKNIHFNYERYEFLGDAVLQLIVSDYLIQNGKSYNEGEMSLFRSYVVCEKFLSAKAKDLDIGKWIFISDGVLKVSKTINNSILADVFEAILGAIYLDSDFATVKDITFKLLKNDIDALLKDTVFIDAKGEIQKYTQMKYGILPKYTVVKAEGPDHKKIYTVKLLINDELSFIGVASTKKNAEKEAAIEALKKLNL